MFNKITNIKYDIDRKGKLTESKNIFRFAYVLDSYKDSPKNYIEHRIEQNQTIEQIAQMYYSDPSYSWVILMYNNLIDIYEDLPKSELVLTDYISKKYLTNNVIEAKRILSLPQLSDMGETLAGTYHGQIVYDESNDRGLKWDAYSGTGKWNSLGGFGVPAPSPRTFHITCNNTSDPKLSTSWLIDGVSDPDLLLIRGGVYTFKIHYSPEDNFYMTTDKGRGWKQYNYWGNYIENQIENVISETFGQKTITFTVPSDAPDTLYYMSQSTLPYPEVPRPANAAEDWIAHPDTTKNEDSKMTGIIRIRNQEEIAYVVGTDKNSLQSINGRVMGKVAKIEEDYYVWNGSYMHPDSTNFVRGWSKLNPENQGNRSYTTGLGLLISHKTPHKFTHFTNDTDISPSTYSLMPDSEKQYFVMQSKFEYEEEKNEKNRTIRIMKQELLGDFLSDWEKVIA